MTYFIALFFAISSVFSFVVGSPVPATNYPLAKRASAPGRGTWFDVGLGACGKTNVNSDAIVAIPASVYSGGSHCDQTVSIKNNANGKSTTATVRDECPSCGSNDLDMSPSVFSSLGDLNAGVLDITWDFN
ncbi:riboflavin aldehyde-forming enzyme [Abortiporus biennis]|nr:riboflavin aldehyde-forming enzyme [Abortiporus biennis]